ncbi:hypothetical protein [Pleionea sp. CnH1-48]|uniref:hypothetical protein n=1 Tax=Pleionea sp. CnH1-48 TaxID=2954494 RepID=UPI002098324E|nr:hypothetical protein [Pleionea sp. CnH1-48]MCO7223253.1 hypothetical protein [Pleionea sp. CnH1-48]
MQKAIEARYPGIYKDVDELKQDYPDFSPQIRQWSDDLSFLFGRGRYAVRLPEEEVIISKTGMVKTTRRCSVEGKAGCKIIPPKHPSLGVVGTLQLGAPSHSPITKYKISWSGTSDGTILTNGHCFAAYKASDEPLELTISVEGFLPIVIKNIYGNRLIAATFDKERNHYGTIRISTDTFNQSKTCLQSVRDQWPNVGGWAWKR